MEPQRQQLDEEEQKLTQTLDALQKRVNDFRTQKETLKAQYTAAKAVSAVDESTAGHLEVRSTTPAPSLQRAQDKIATMQARSGALDELLESGVLEDVGGGTDDIQKELDQVGKDAQVDNELAALKAQLGTGAPPEPDALAARPGAATARPRPRLDARAIVFSRRGRVASRRRSAPRRRPARARGPPGGSARRRAMVTCARPARAGTRACSTSAQPRVPGIAVGERGEEGAVEGRQHRAACARFSRAHSLRGREPHQQGQLARARRRRPRRGTARRRPPGRRPAPPTRWPPARRGSGRNGVSSWVRRW